MVVGMRKCIIIKILNIFRREINSFSFERYDSKLDHRLWGKGELLYTVVCSLKDTMPSAIVYTVTIRIIPNKR